MAFVHPGANNTYTPAFGNGAASDQLQVEYSRNPSSFALNRYARIVPVTKQAGLFAQISTEDAVRVTDTDKYIWPDGTPRPRGETRRHEFSEYACKRYSYGFTMGELAAEQADFDVIASHARGAATKAMTARSAIAGDLIDNTSNALSNDTAGNVGGGKWDVAGGSNANYIKATIQSVCQTILKQTGGVVRPSDLVLVINPDVAVQAAASDEITDLINGSPAAYDMLQGSATFQMWGLPPVLYGVEVVVEDAVRVATQEGETTAYSYVIDDDAIFLARPNTLVSPVNSNTAPTMATLSIFAYEDMTVETKTDDWDRFVAGSVVDNYDIKLTNTLSGYLVTDVVD